MKERNLVARKGIGSNEELFLEVEVNCLCARQMGWNLKREQTVDTGEEGTNIGPIVGPCAAGWPTLSQSQPVVMVSSSLPGTGLGMNT